MPKSVGKNLVKNFPKTYIISYQYIVLVFIILASSSFVPEKSGCENRSGGVRVIFRRAGSLKSRYILYFIFIVPKDEEKHVKLASCLFPSSPTSMYVIFLLPLICKIQAGNWIFWVLFCVVGQPMSLLCYYRDYCSEHECSNPLMS